MFAGRLGRRRAASRLRDRCVDNRRFDPADRQRAQLDRARRLRAKLLSGLGELRGGRAVEDDVYGEDAAVEAAALIVRNDRSGVARVQQSDIRRSIVARRHHELAGRVIEHVRPAVVGIDRQRARGPRAAQIRRGGRLRGAEQQRDQRSQETTRA